MADQPQETTDFGFRTVARDEKQAMVADVFHSVAAKYDVMNDLMSFGIHRIWKRFTIDCSGVRRGQRVLDLAGGTGDWRPSSPAWSASRGRWCWRTSTIRC